MMKPGWIYRITNPSGRSYIGQTKNISERTKYYSGVRCKEQKQIYNSLLKHGWDNHKFEILEEFPPSEFINEILNACEIYWVSFYNSYKNGMNLTPGGMGGGTGRPPRSIAIYNKRGEFIEELRGVSEAAKKYNIDKSVISKSCIGKRKGMYSLRTPYIFKYSDETNNNPIDTSIIKHGYTKEKNKTKPNGSMFKL